MGDLKSARTPYIYNVSVASKNKEYSKDLPSGLKSMQVQFTKSSILHIYFTTGATAADRFPMKAGGTYSANGLDLRSSTTMYFICPSTTGTVSIIGWGG